MADNREKAGPQREDGHLDIANELVVQFCRAGFTRQEWQILWVILHKTWGWVEPDKNGNIQKDNKGWVRKKKFDNISLSQFGELTGIDRRRCHQIIVDLIDKGVVIKCDTLPGHTNRYGFQKNYAKWGWDKLSQKTTIVENIYSRKMRQTVVEKCDGPSQKTTHTKDILKNINSGRKKRPPNPDLIEVEKFWMDNYQTRLGEAYDLKFKVHRSILNRLLNKHGIEKVRETMLFLLDTDDPWLRHNRGIEITTLSGEWNSIRQKIIDNGNGSGPKPEPTPSREVRLANADR